MMAYAQSPYRITEADAEKFRISAHGTAPGSVADIALDKKSLKEALAKEVEALDELQQQFYADGRFSLLLVFQAMDAAGKDSTIRRVFSGVNPAGFRVHSFKQPSSKELAHHFLWRTTRVEPERGFIGIFNRSYYEEVLVVRVHPEYLKAQQLPDTDDLDAVWQQRFAAIRSHERMLYDSGTLVLKFFLHVSQQEQHRRFLDRLQKPHKRWKFSPADLSESVQWDKYMQAYEDAIINTSRDCAPWFVIPADDKRYMRYRVAQIVRATLQGLPLHYPELDASEEQVAVWAQQLKTSLSAED